MRRDGSLRIIVITIDSSIIALLTKIVKITRMMVNQISTITSFEIIQITRIDDSTRTVKCPTQILNTVRNITPSSNSNQQGYTQNQGSDSNEPRFQNTMSSVRTRQVTPQSPRSSNEQGNQQSQTPSREVLQLTPSRVRVLPQIKPQLGNHNSLRVPPFDRIQTVSWLMIIERS